MLGTYSSWRARKCYLCWAWGNQQGLSQGRGRCRERRKGTLERTIGWKERQKLKPPKPLMPLDLVLWLMGI